MISKERLEELIEQGATIYELYMNKNIIEIQLKNGWFVMQDGLYEAKLGKHPFRSWWISNLYETKEDAEFVREFGCIERTERLKLPTWEEFNEMSSFIFENKDGINLEMAIWCCDREDLQIKTIKITNLNDWNIRLFEQPLTKENYTLACRKAKELFLGEKNESVCR